MHLLLNKVMTKLNPSLMNFFCSGLVFIRGSIRRTLFVFNEKRSPVKAPEDYARSKVCNSLFISHSLE